MKKILKIIAKGIVLILIAIFPFVTFFGGQKYGEIYSKLLNSTVEFNKSKVNINIPTPQEPTTVVPKMTKNLGINPLDVPVLFYNETKKSLFVLLPKSETKLIVKEPIEKDLFSATLSPDNNIVAFTEQYDYTQTNMVEGFGPTLSTRLLYRTNFFSIKDKKILNKFDSTERTYVVNWSPDQTKFIVSTEYNGLYTYSYPELKKTNKINALKVNWLDNENLIAQTNTTEKDNYGYISVINPNKVVKINVNSLSQEDILKEVPIRYYDIKEFKNNILTYSLRYSSRDDYFYDEIYTLDMSTNKTSSLGSYDSSFFSQYDKYQNQRETIRYILSMFKDVLVGYFKEPLVTDKSEKKFVFSFHNVMKNSDGKDEVYSIDLDHPYDSLNMVSNISNLWGPT